MSVVVRALVRTLGGHSVSFFIFHFVLYLFFVLLLLEDQQQQQRCESWEPRRKLEGESFSLAPYENEGERNKENRPRERVLGVEKVGKRDSLAIATMQGV